MELATVPVPACPVCGGETATLLHAQLSDRVFGVAPGTWRLVRCSDCGAARLDPRPSDDAIPSLYAAYYTHSAPPSNLEPPTRIGRALRALRNDHLNVHLGYRLAPAWRAGRVLARVLPPWRAMAERELRSLPLAGRLLDVGCGNGQFVAEAAAAGWRAAGIDLDAQAISAGRAAGLDVAVETIEARAAREPGAYDALTLSHVIEHIADPPAFVRHAYALLRPGGTIWVATPNLESDGHRAFGPDWLHLDPPRHLVLFTGRSLVRALASAGFADARVLRAPLGTLPAFRVSHHVRAGAVPAHDVLEYPPAVRRAALRALARSTRDRRRAEELVVLARRPATEPRSGPPQRSPSTSRSSAS
jgi:2-polyprenyl-3-methyl-5-hydroxy-6-metoxy-1,4-benzoquinol methylase